MICHKTKIENVDALTMSDRPAHLGVVNAFFRALGWNVAVDRHYESDGGQLYFHERDDAADLPIKVTWAVDAGTFYQQTIEGFHRADDMTFEVWREVALGRNDTEA